MFRRRSIEDDPIIQKAHQALLEIFGLTVEVAKTGKQALQYVQQNHYDIILLDIGLPDIDGIQVCQQIRAQTASHPMPIIILSAQGEYARQAALIAGANDFAIKPISAEMLKELLEKWLLKFF